MWNTTEYRIWDIEDIEGRVQKKKNIEKRKHC